MHIVTRPPRAPSRRLGLTHLLAETTDCPGALAARPTGVDAPLSVDLTDAPNGPGQTPGRFNTFLAGELVENHNSPRHQTCESPKDQQDAKPDGERQFNREQSAREQQDDERSGDQDRRPDAENDHEAGDVVDVDRVGVQG
jgi:hypothetical protein